MARVSALAIMIARSRTPSVMPPCLSRADLFRSRLKAFERAASDVKHGDRRGVHRLRVAVRRLRELLPILPIDRDRSRRMARSLRRVARQVAELRDVDVLLGLVAQPPTGAPPAALEIVQGSLRSQRAKAQARVTDRSARARLHRQVKRLHKIGRDVERAEGGSPRPWRLALEARVARRGQGLRGVIEGAGTIYMPERLHDVRIAIKKLRYALELVGEVGHDVAPDLMVLRHGQRLLGALHDAAALAAYVRHIRPATPSSPSLGSQDLRDLADLLDGECRRLHARYVRVRHAALSVCARAVGTPVAAVRRAG